MTILDDLEALYRKTGNPLFVWRAMAECGPGMDPRRPLPDWVREYLEVVAWEFERLNFNVDAKLSASEKIKRVPAALGLVGKGRGGNAFARWKKVNDDATIAFWHDEARRQGVKGEAWVHDFMCRHCMDRATVRRRIAAARQLWKAQEKGSQKDR